MSTYPRSFIEQVKDKVDIIDIAREHMDVQRVGDNLWNAHCPDHSVHEGGDDSDPSLYIYGGENQSFYCYGCGAGSAESKTQSSDVIAFVRWLKGISFQDALQYLASKAGVPVPSASSQEYEEAKRLHELTAERMVLYHNTLKQDENFLRYLYDRGITDEDIQTWMLGKVPNKPEFDEARGRLAFPILSMMGTPLAFGYRAMHGEKPKYINTPDNIIWKKGKHLYGLDKAYPHIINSKTAVICEGYTDVILLHKHGVVNTVGTMGTTLTDEQVKLLKRFASGATLFIDGDTPGQEAASRQIKKLREFDISVSVIPLYGGLDPADRAKELKDSLLEFMQQNEVLWPQYEVGKVMNRYYSAWNKLRMDTIRELAPIFDEMGDNERGMYINIVRDLLEVRPWYERNKDNLARAIRDFEELC